MLLIVSPAELRKVIRDGCNVGLPGAPIVPIRGEHAGAKPTSSLGGPEASGRYQAQAAHPRRQVRKRMYAATANATPYATTRLYRVECSCTASTDARSSFTRRSRLGAIGRALSQMSDRPGAVRRPAAY